MATMDISAELYSKIESLQDDENSMKKVLDYINKLLAKREVPKPVISKEQVKADLKGAMTQFALYKEGKAKFTSWEDFQDELQREGYND